MRIVQSDVAIAAGPMQVWAGFQGGCEAAIHAMRETFNNEGTEAILLVGTANAFNSLNRKAALHNLRFICPALATILANTYQSPTRLFVTGGGEIASSEGTTQGDPLGLAMYALAVVPLINKLQQKHQQAQQDWFADDATATSTCQQLRAWWDDLASLGPSFGYYSKAAKTSLVVKKEFVEEAERIFADTNISITSSSKRHLGAANGSQSFE